MTKMMSVALLSAALLLPAQKPEAAESLLQAATKKEVVDGDLAGAIEGYKKTMAAAKGNRAIAAKALYQLGECYRKQGNAQARQTFERLVKEYADQAVAGQARARLAAMGGDGGGKKTRARLLWDAVTDGEDGAYGWGVRGTTADGRRVAFAVGKRDLAIRDLVTGEQRRVTNKGKDAKPAEWAEQTLISPDGSRLAFLWGQDIPNTNNAHYSVRVVRADGTDERVLLEAGKPTAAADEVYYYVDSWSPDGKWIAVHELHGGRSARLALVSPDDGGVRTLFTVPEGYGGLDNLIRFSPDGRWLAFGARAQSPEVGNSVFTLPVAEAAATPAEIASRAEVVGWTPDGNAILLTRMRDTTPELFLQPVANGRAAGELRKVQSVPGFEDWPVAVTPSGSLVYKAMNRTADGVVANIDLDSATIGKAVINQGIGTWNWLRHAVRFSPDGRRVLFVLADRRVLIRPLEQESGNTILVQMKTLDRVEWAADGASLLVSGVGKDGQAGLHRVDADSGAASLVAAIQPAVFAPSRDGKTVLCYNTGRGFSTLDLETGRLQPSAWAKPAYRILDMSFSHDGKKLALFGAGIVEVLHVATGRFQRIITTPGSNYPGGDWSPDDRFLFATRPQERAASRLIRFPAEGGTPVTTTLPAHYRGLRLSPDGKSVALTRFNEHPQIWVLENFLPAAVARKK